MPIVEKRRARLTVNDVPASEMAVLGRGMAHDAIRRRIQRGLTVHDTPAPALNAQYAKRKLRNGKKPIRDWTKSGRMLQELGVVFARPNRVRIGVQSARADRLITVNNRRSQQYGVSAADKRHLEELVKSVKSPVEVKRTA